MNEFGIPFKWWRSLYKSFDKFIDVRRMNWHVGVPRQFVSIVRHNLQNDEPHTECQTETNWISIEILSLFVRKWSRKRNRCVSSDVGIRQIAWNYLKFFDVSRCIDECINSQNQSKSFSKRCFQILSDAFRFIGCFVMWFRARFWRCFVWGCTRELRQIIKPKNF